MPPHSPDRPARVFICYSRADLTFLEELETHLANLKRQRRIELWNDQTVEAGEVWEPAMLRLLDDADLILVLASSDFMHSDFMNDVMLRRALARHDRGEARLIPILVRPVDIVGSALGHLKALPPNRQPVTAWKDRDKAWMTVVEEIRGVLVSQQGAIPPPPRLSELPAGSWRRFQKLSGGWFHGSGILPALGLTALLLLLFTLMSNQYLKVSSYDELSTEPSSLNPIALTILWMDLPRGKNNTSELEAAGLEQRLAMEVLPKLRALGAASIVLDMAFFGVADPGRSDHGSMRRLLASWRAANSGWGDNPAVPKVVARIPSSPAVEWSIRPCELETGAGQGTGAPISAQPLSKRDVQACFDWLIAFELELPSGQIVACPDNSASLALGIAWMIRDLSQPFGGPLPSRLCTHEQVLPQNLSGLHVAAGPRQPFLLTRVLGSTSDPIPAPTLPYLELSASALSASDEAIRHFIAGRVVLIGVHLEQGPGITRMVDPDSGLEVSSAEATRFQAGAAAWLTMQQGRRP